MQNSFCGKWPPDCGVRLVVFEGVAGATEGPPAVFDSQARPQQARFHEESPSSATARLNGRMIAWLEHLQRPDLLSASWRTGIGSKTAAASETQAFASAQVDPRAELRHEASCHHTMQALTYTCLLSYYFTRLSPPRLGSRFGSCTFSKSRSGAVRRRAVVRMACEAERVRFLRWR